ncbi:hypothetical protein DFJ73DRAFT_965242 [Zopfochytrium polystomum]|nr:hypothetical protein DFJ73DRAFT_965242 [Zopfochytrium polystomum]
MLEAPQSPSSSSSSSSSSPPPTLSPSASTTAPSVASPSSSSSSRSSSSYAPSSQSLFTSVMGANRVTISVLPAAEAFLRLPPGSCSSSSSSSTSSSASSPRGVSFIHGLPGLSTPQNSLHVQGHVSVANILAHHEILSVRVGFRASVVTSNGDARVHSPLEKSEVVWIDGCEVFASTIGSGGPGAVGLSAAGVDAVEEGEPDGKESAEGPRTVEIPFKIRIDDEKALLLPSLDAADPEWGFGARIEYEVVAEVFVDIGGPDARRKRGIASVGEAVADAARLFPVVRSSTGVRSGPSPWNPQSSKLLQASAASSTSADSPWWWPSWIWSSPPPPPPQSSRSAAASVGTRANYRHGRHPPTDNHHHYHHTHPLVHALHRRYALATWLLREIASAPVLVKRYAPAPLLRAANVGGKAGTWTWSSVADDGRTGGPSTARSDDTSGGADGEVNVEATLGRCCFGPADEVPFHIKVLSPPPILGAPLLVCRIWLEETQGVGIVIGGGGGGDDRGAPPTPRRPAHAGTDEFQHDPAKDPYMLKMREMMDGTSLGRKYMRHRVALWEVPESEPGEFSRDGGKKLLLKIPPLAAALRMRAKATRSYGLVGGWLSYFAPKTLGVNPSGSFANRIAITHEFHFELASSALPPSQPYPTVLYAPPPAPVTVTAFSAEEARSVIEVVPGLRRDVEAAEARGGGGGCGTSERRMVGMPGGGVFERMESEATLVGEDAAA